MRERIAALGGAIALTSGPTGSRVEMRVSSSCSPRTRDLTVVLKGTSGAEAVAGVRVYEPDLLLLDLKLPDMSGLDVLRMLQPEHRPTRIVLLTAAAGRSDVDQARALGAAGMLYKDVDLREARGGRSSRSAASRTPCRHRRLITVSS